MEKSNEVKLSLCRTEQKTMNSRIGENGTYFIKCERCQYKFRANGEDGMSVINEIIWNCPHCGQPHFEELPKPVKLKPVPHHSELTVEI